MSKLSEIAKLRIENAQLNNVISDLHIHGTRQQGRIGELEKEIIDRQDTEIALTAWVSELGKQNDEFKKKIIRCDVLLKAAEEVSFIHGDGCNCLVCEAVHANNKEM